MTHSKSSLQTAKENLVSVLQSRRVLTALAAMLVGVITLLVPQLQAVQDELLILIVTVSLALIGGFSMDEAARIGKERANQDDEQLRELIKELLTELFEEMMDEEKENPHV
jgi:hypothetical protein